MVKHRPLTNTEKVCKVYSEKDGVPIKYVCTTSLEPRGRPFDIFYRDTPHPDFGNHYFGTDGVFIVNGDRVEDYVFECIEGPGGWEYSRHVHDFITVGDGAIDGGREYTRRLGSVIPEVKQFVVRDGAFVENNS